MNLQRTMTCPKCSLESKLFVEFVALIYLSYIQTYTMHKLLDELDVIECFMEPGKTLIRGEVLKKKEQVTGI